MITYIIVCRNPGSRKLLVIVDDAGDIVEFDTEDKAMDHAQRIAGCVAWGAEIVPVCPP